MSFCVLSWELGSQQSERMSLFGQERLIKVILSGRRGSDLLDALLSEVVASSNSPTNQDDITLLAVDLAELAADLDVAPGV